MDVRRASIFILLILFLTSTLFAIEYVSGSISGVWGPENIIVIGDAYISAGSSLSISPGCTISFEDNYRITVNGTLQAVGTKENNIEFTALDTLAGWGGIRFVGSRGISTLDYCEFNFGHAGQENNNGGSVFIDGGSIVEILNSVFQKNSAPNGSGGAIYCSGDARLSLTKSKFIGNMAGISGGAIYTENSEINLTNNLIANNEALSGGGVYIAGCDSTLLLNNTIGFNLAESGGGVYLYNTDETYIVNNIIWGNESAQATITESSCNSLYNNISQDIGGDWDIYAEPLFIRPPSGAGNASSSPFSVWYVSSLSPCIDSGKPAMQGYFLPDNDILGNPRVWNERVDIGAFEYHPDFVKADYKICGACTGDAPRRVQFINLSYGNITGYEWDFNNDGVIDSQELHPRPTYNIWGKYTVRLVAYNGELRDTIIRGNHVEVYAPVDFSPDSLVFSGNPYGQAYLSSFQITNVSDEVNINIRSMQLSKNENNAFRIINPLNNSDYITPGSNKTFQISYNAGLDDDPPVSRGEIEIETDDNGNIYYRLIGSWESGIPVIDFEADVAQGIFPMTVNFLNKSRYGIDYYWDIDNDGVIDSYSKDYSAVYSEPGLYSVSLKGENEYGEAIKLKSRYINCMPRFLWENYSLSSVFASPLVDLDQADFGDTIFYKGRINFPYFSGSSILSFSSTLSQPETINFQIELISDSVLAGFLVLDEYTDIAQNIVEITNDELITLQVSGGQAISLITGSYQHSIPTVMNLYRDSAYTLELGNSTSDSVIYSQVILPGTRALNLRGIIQSGSVEQDFYMFQAEGNAYRGSINLQDFLPLGYGRCIVYPEGAENLGQEFLYYQPDIPSEPDSAVFIDENGTLIQSAGLGSELQIRINEPTGELRLISSVDAVGIPLVFTDSVAIITPGAYSSESENIIQAVPGGWIEAISFDGSTVLFHLDIQEIELGGFSLITPEHLAENVDVFPRLLWQSSIEREEYYPTYQIYISTSPDFADSLTAMFNSYKTEFYPPKDLEEETTYFWKVKASLGDTEVWSQDEDGYRMFTTISNDGANITIGGLLNSNRELIAENSPYYISDSVYTGTGIDFSVGPGVEILIEPEAGIRIGGNIYINGNETDSVYFRAVSSGRWGGISFADNSFSRHNLYLNNQNDFVSGNIIKHAVICNAQKPLSANHDIYLGNSRFSSCSKGIYPGNGSVVKNCIIEDIDSILITEYAVGGAKHLENNIIRDISGSAVWGGENTKYINNLIEYVEGKGLINGILFKNNRIESCEGTGITCSAGAVAAGNAISGSAAGGITGGSVIYGNHIFNNQGNGILCDSMAHLSGNTIENNGGYGIRGGNTLSGNIVRNVGLFGIWCHSQATLSGNVIENCMDGLGLKGGIYLENNHVSGCSEGGIFCSLNAELRGNYSENNGDYGIQNGMILTNNTVSGNNSYGIKCNEMAELSRNIVVNNREYGVWGGYIIDNNTIEGNLQYGITCLDSAIVTNNLISGNGSYGLSGGKTITGNNIRNNGGYAIGGSTDGVINYNNIEGNQGFAFINAIEAIGNAVVNNTCENSSLIIYKGELFSGNTITGNIVIDGSSSYQDSMFNYSIVDFTNPSGCEIAQNTIKYNTFNDFNICAVNGENYTIKNNIISDNEYQNSNSGLPEGTPLFVGTEGYLEISGNKFLDNSGGYAGGGFYLYSADSAYIGNNIVYNNKLQSPGSKGGGAWIGCANTILENNTFTGNIADSGSAIYGRCTSVSGNIITENTGGYAIVSAPEVLRNNNIFDNFTNNDTVETNLYYYENEDIIYSHNFWGTRRVDGYIDRTIFDDEESNGEFGSVSYQPILTNPVQTAQSSNTNIDTIMATSSSISILPYEFGIIDGKGINICLIAEDPNEYSRDITCFTATNLANNLSIEPLIRETDYNSGVFRTIIYLSRDEYNPIEKKLMASEGDIIRIQSSDDSMKTFMLHAIGGGLILPSSISYNEDEWIQLDFTDFITFQDLSNYTLDVLPAEHINILVDGFSVAFSSPLNWFGSESVVFSLTDGRQQAVFDTTVVNVLPVNDEPGLIEPLPEVTINNLTSYYIDLGDYFYDVEDTLLSYEAVCDNVNILINIEESIMEISTTHTWTGKDTLVVRAMDNQFAEAEGALLITVKSSFSLTLNEGWNLISLPIEQGLYDPADVLPNALEIYEHVDSGWTEPVYLEPGKGYWVRNSIDQVLELDYPPLTSIYHQLSGGWSLIGVLSAQSYINSNNISSIWSFRNRTWAQVSPNGGILMPGYAYWMKINNFMILELIPYSRSKESEVMPLPGGKKPETPFLKSPADIRNDKK